MRQSKKSRLCYFHSVPYTIYRLCNYTDVVSNLCKCYKEQLIKSVATNFCLSILSCLVHHILVCLKCSVDASIISNVLTQCELTINLRIYAAILHETQHIILVYLVPLQAITTILVHKALSTLIKLRYWFISPPLGASTIFIKQTTYKCIHTKSSYVRMDVSNSYLLTIAT